MSTSLAAACGTAAPAKPGVLFFFYQQWLTSAGADHWFALCSPARSCGQCNQVPTHILHTRACLLQHTSAQALSCPAQVTGTLSAILLSSLASHDKVLLHEGVIAGTSSAVQLSLLHLFDVVVLLLKERWGGAWSRQFPIKWANGDRPASRVELAAQTNESGRHAVWLWAPRHATFWDAQWLASR